MAASFVQEAGGTTAASATSMGVAWPAATTAGNLLMMGVVVSSNGVDTDVVVPAGWTQCGTTVTSKGGGSTPLVQEMLFRLENAPSQSGTKTISFVKTGTTTPVSVNASMFLAEFGGVLVGAAIDLQASASATSTTDASGTTATTAQANELVIALLGAANNPAMTGITNSFTLQDTQRSAASGATKVSAGFAYRIVSSTGTYGTAVTLGSSQANVGKVVTFRAATAATVQTVTASGSTRGGTGSVLVGGVSNRTNTNNSTLATQLAKHPNLKLITFYACHDTIEPSAPADATHGTYAFANMKTALENAAATGTGVRVLLRFEWGYRTAQWIYSTAINPVTKLNLVDDGGPGNPGNGNHSPGASPDNTYVPLPWTSSVDGTTNANLIVHYKRFLIALDAVLKGAFPGGGTYADHVYFCSVSMPTTVGTEMSLGYQAADPFTGVYDGLAANVSANPTYHSINKAEWDRYGVEASRQTWYTNAWRKAADLHMQYLTSVPSSVAYGTSFGNWSGPQQMATDYAKTFPTRICHMTTDLKVDIAPGGTYAGADSGGSTAILNAVAQGGWVGFQSASNAIVKNAAQEKASTDDGLATYHMSFYEASEPNISNFYNPATDGSGWLGMEDLQNRILAQASSQTDDSPPKILIPDTTGYTSIVLGGGSPHNWTNDSESHTLADNTNYVITWPARLHQGHVIINLGNNNTVVMLGGYKAIGLTTGGADPAQGGGTQASGDFNIKWLDGGNTGSKVYVVGLHIDGSQSPVSPLFGLGNVVEQDGLRMSAPNTKFYLKNVREEQLHGQFDTGHKHADDIQPDGAFLELHIEDCYFSSYYNCLYLRRENSPLGPPMGKLYINRAESERLTPNPVPGKVQGTLTAISMGTQPSDANGGAGNDASAENVLLQGGCWFKDFYGTPTGTTLDKFLHPANTTGNYAPGRPVLAGDGQSAAWPLWATTTFPPPSELTPSAFVSGSWNEGSGDAKVYGVINLGPPPNDFAPASRVGLNYTAPFSVVDQGGGTTNPTPSVNTSMTAHLNTVVSSSIPFVMDDYNRIVAAGGLGTPSLSGNAYTLGGTAGDFSVNGSAAVIAVTAAAQTKSASLTGVTMDDQILFARWQADKVAAGSFSAFDFRGRAVDGSNFYKIRYFINTNGSITIRVSKVIANVTTNLGADTSVVGTFAVNNYYSCRCMITTDTGVTTISARIWDSDAIEPTTWQWTGTDTEATLMGALPVAYDVVLNTGSTANTTTFMIDEFSAFPYIPTALGGNILITGTASGRFTQKVKPTGKKHTPRV